MLTVLVYLLNRANFFRVCSICAGIAGVWIGLVVLRLAGRSVDPVVLALLLGGSVVGAMYLIEKEAHELHLYQKTGLVLAGFAGAYGIVVESWVEAALGILAFALLYMLVRRGTGRHDAAPANKDLIKKMEDCC